MNKDTFSRRIIVALVRDNPGVLAAIVGVIRRRGINIASLAVGHSEKNKKFLILLCQPTYYLLHPLLYQK